MRVQLRGPDSNRQFDAHVPGPVGSGDRWRMLSLERESEIDGGHVIRGRTVTTSFSFSFALLAHPAVLGTTGSCGLSRTYTSRRAHARDKA